MSFIAEGGHGRIRAKSEPGAFKVELEGEFTSSIVELSSGALASDAAP